MIAADHRLRELVGAAAGALMEAEIESVAGAGYHVPSATRRVQRNGYRPRSWRTPIGRVDLEIPKLRRGSYCPRWLFAAEGAFVDAIARGYADGVSAAWVEELIAALGLRLPPPQVREITIAIAEEVAAAREVSARAS